MLVMMGPFICAGALMAGRNGGKEARPKTLACDAGGEKVPDCVLMGDILGPWGGALMGLCNVGED